MPRVNWQGKRQSCLFLATACFIIAIDQISKIWIRNNLPPEISLPHEGFARLTHVQNTGSAFGILTNQAFLLTIIALAGILFIALFYYRFSSPTNLNAFALGLVLGGAVGNLIDRICLGYVTDFIDVRLWGDFHWPAFNLADTSITIGTFIVVGSLLWLAKKRG